MIRYPATLLIILFHLAVTAQDTLPRFSVVVKSNNRNVISWTNPFARISQIGIQRSADSLRNFKTILTVPDPAIPQNGFVDTKAPAGSNYYRLFMVLDSGRYLFSRSMKPAPDTAASGTEPVLKNDNQRVVLSDSLNSREVITLKEKLQPANSLKQKAEKFFVVTKRGSFVSRIPERLVKRLRDSIIYGTHDTMVFASVDTILIKPYVLKEVYKASKYVFTEKFGNVMIELPDATSKKYAIRFFEENKDPLFEIAELPSTSLTIDKTNFVHSGWFWFELYENGQLKERHKFFIPKDF